MTEPQALTKAMANMRAKGFDFYDWAAGEIRFVTSWDQKPDAVRPLAEAIGRL